MWGASHVPAGTHFSAPAVPILLSLPHRELRTHPAHLFLIIPATHHVPWVPVSLPGCVYQHPSYSPSWLLWGWILGLFFLLLLFVCFWGRSCWWHWGKGREAGKWPGWWGPLSSDSRLAHSWLLWRWALGSVSEVASPTWSPPFSGKPHALFPLAGFSSLLIYTLLTRHLPCPEMISSGRFPQYWMKGTEIIRTHAGYWETGPRLLRFFVEQSGKHQDWPQAEGEFCKAAAPSHWGSRSSTFMLIVGSNNRIWL